MGFLVWFLRNSVLELYTSTCSSIDAINFHHWWLDFDVPTIHSIVLIVCDSKSLLERGVEHNFSHNLRSNTASFGLSYINATGVCVCAFKCATSNTIRCPNPHPIHSSGHVGELKLRAIAKKITPYRRFGISLTWLSLETSASSSHATDWGWGEEGSLWLELLRWYLAALIAPNVA